METTETAKAVLHELSLGNFLSGMETEYGTSPRSSCAILGNFLSGMETLLLYILCFILCTLETSLVEWKHAWLWGRWRATLALETSLVEWKLISIPERAPVPTPWKLP